MVRICRYAGLTIGFAALFLSLQCTKPVDKAAEREAQGDFQGALVRYLGIVVDRAKSDKPPEKSLARVNTQEKWSETIRTYVEAVGGRGRPAGKAFAMAVAGAARCTSRVMPENFVSVSRCTASTVESFSEQWQEMFFPRDVEPVASQRIDAQEARKKEYSIITFKTERSYTYTAHLVNPSRGTRTDLTLYPESQTRVLALPGPHLLVCVSTVTFPNGSVWRSPMTVDAFMVPDSSSLLVCDVRTRVKRGN